MLPACRGWGPGVLHPPQGPGRPPGERPSPRHQQCRGGTSKRGAAHAAVATAPREAVPVLVLASFRPRVHRSPVSPLRCAVFWGDCPPLITAAQCLQGQGPARPRLGEPDASAGAGSGLRGCQPFWEASPGPGGGCSASDFSLTSPRVVPLATPGLDQPLAEGEGSRVGA